MKHIKTESITKAYSAWPGVIEYYREYLPVTDKTPMITLREGNTPLIPAPELAKAICAPSELYLKFEGLNPTGSFKDRGMTMAVSKAVEEGSEMIMCASTGNTSASAAAYAARAGIRCFVLVEGGGIALGKLAQAVMHGATVFEIDGNFDQALAMVLEITSKYPIMLVNSLNPYRVEGQMTASFEVCDQLGGYCPDYHILPVGNAANITAYWKGYKVYHERENVSGTPKMIGFQAEGAAPIVRGKRIMEPSTIATAIKIGNPASWKNAERARDESGGLIDMVSDEEIVKAYRLLASRMGIFAEPASAASIAGLAKLSGQGFFKKDDTVVCTLTGHGLKDPDRAVKCANRPVRISAEIDSLKRVLNL